MYIIHSDSQSHMSSKCPYYALRLFSGVRTNDTCTITDCVLGLIDRGKYKYRLCYLQHISCTAYSVSRFTKSICKRLHDNYEADISYAWAG